jgi:hypothetical protein
MADPRTGTGKVVAEAEAPKPAQQLSLLGSSGAESDEAVAEVVERRGRGRPAGAVNRATRDLRAFVTAQYRHPLVTLARIQAQDPVELAKSLGCKPAEALDRIQRAATELAPYLVGKMPVQDANGDAVLPVLNLVDPRLLAALDQAEGAVRPVNLADLQVIENVQFSEVPGGGVGQSESDGFAETQAQSGVAGGEPVIWDHGGQGGGDAV